MIHLRKPETLALISLLRTLSDNAVTDVTSVPKDYNVPPIVLPAAVKNEVDSLYWTLIDMQGKSWNPRGSNPYRVGGG